MSENSTSECNIELRNIDSIQPYERNPRLNDKAVDAVSASLKEFGFRQPIVVDTGGVIIAGHTRWKAAKKLGLAKVPVHVATDLSPEQVRAYRIADNKSAELADWDMEILPIELSELRESQHAANLFPSHGQYVGATSLPFAAHKKQRGDRIGHHWRIPGVVGTRAIRHVMIDTNYWKTFVHARLGIPMGDPGCLSLFGHEAKRHRLLAEHLTAEYRVRTMAYSRTVDEWKTRPSRPDNHWFDCLVGCAVAASIQGAELPTFQTKNDPARPRIKLSDRQFKRRIL